jgi:hypothetical protein
MGGTEFFVDDHVVDINTRACTFFEASGTCFETTQNVKHKLIVFTFDVAMCIRSTSGFSAIAWGFAFGVRF